MFIDNSGVAWIPGDLVYFVWDGGRIIGKIVDTPPYELKRNLIRIRGMNWINPDEYVWRNINLIRKLTLHEQTLWYLEN